MVDIITIRGFSYSLGKLLYYTTEDDIPASITNAFDMLYKRDTLIIDEEYLEKGFYEQASKHDKTGEEIEKLFNSKKLILNKLINNLKEVLV